MEKLLALLREAGTALAEAGVLIDTAQKNLDEAKALEESLPTPA